MEGTYVVTADRYSSVLILKKVITKIYRINYTDIQPKISIDEISLLWLFCGC